MYVLLTTLAWLLRPTVDILVDLQPISIYRDNIVIYELPIFHIPGNDYFYQSIIYLISCI